jgi:peptidyl-prolyl cis-trans isomerase D
LIERSLLAARAREIGFSVEEREVFERLFERGTVLLTLSVDAPSHLPSGEIAIGVRDEDGNIDKDGAQRFIQYGLGRSINEFAEAQAEEVLAERMRTLIAANVHVSPREVWDAFVRERERVTVRYVRYAPAFYEEQLAPTAEELTAWISANADAVGTEYEANKHRYTGLEKQVRARHILIQAEESADDATKQAARARAEALLAQARTGSDFATLAKENSEDEGSARSGGDLGYNPRGRMVTPFDDAQFGLEVGQISDIVESRFGFHIIKVEGIREGDVPEDEAKREIGERMYRERRAGELAREAATRLLTELKGGKTFDVVEQELSPPAETAEGAAPETAEDDDVGSPLAPRVQTSRPFGRADTPITGVDSTPMLRTVFDMDTDSFPDEPLQMGSDFFVYQVTEHTRATEEDFTDAVKDRIRGGLQRAREREVVQVYVHALRSTAEEAGDVEINPETTALRYGAEEEEEAGGEEEAGDEEADDEDSTEREAE